MSPYPTEIPERTHRGRFVTLCQQLLALAVVVAVLTPAARTVTMDVRPAQPAGGGTADMALRSAAAPSKVPTAAVEPVVEEYALTAPAGAVKARVALRATAAARTGGGSTITSNALPVDGYGTVGVTWSAAAKVGDDAIAIKVRTRTGNAAWSGWTKAEYHDEHAPDPSSKEARNARPGTEAVLVGDVDAVQVKVTTKKSAPADMKLAVIDPGKADATAQQKPSIDTARMSGDAATTTDDVPATPDAGTGEEDAIALQATTYTPKPQIYSRAQWGADERLRSKSSLNYYEVQAGFVHHTVNANDYKKSDVPGIIRGIYSYHVKSRGWSDVGYNFLVDRFGRIWEGRAGGVDRPVVGAHTSGYNNYAFAMSAIGNFETARPTTEMLNAYGALFAWKLSLHGISATASGLTVGSRKFPAINGHRDAGSTACPGRYLYEQLGTIRTLAAKAQKGWSGRELAGNYIGSANPDIVTRNAKTGVLVLHDVAYKDGRWRLVGKVRTTIRAPWASSIHRVGDWDRDGYNDIIAVRPSDGALIWYRGKGGGKFEGGRGLAGGFKNVTMLAAVGDVTGDGYPDLIGQPKGGKMTIYPGNGRGGLKPSYPAYGAVPGSRQIPVGLWNADGAPDSIVANGSSLNLYRGNGPGGWTSPKKVGTASGYDWLIGLGKMPGTSARLILVRNAATKQVYAVPRVGGKLGTPVIMNKRAKFDLAG